MTDKELIQALDSELLKLMFEVSDFMKGRKTLNELKEAEGDAEKFRSLTPRSTIQQLNQ